MCALSEIDLIMDAGYTCNCSKRDDLTFTLKLHYTLLKSLGETDQLKEGMSINRVTEALAKYLDVMKPLFVANTSSPLTAGNFTVLLLVRVWYSSLCRVNLYTLKCLFFQHINCIARVGERAV